MEIRIGKEKRHLEVGGAASGGRRGTCSRAEQLTIVGEGFYGLPAGLGLFCSLSSSFYFFFSLFIPKPYYCFEFF